tara:strand:+ start:156 stop:392 length:237 start_codon:yes stop_codon:yes gene_type:complete
MAKKQTIAEKLIDKSKAYKGIFFKTRENLQILNADFENHMYENDQKVAALIEENSMVGEEVLSNKSVIKNIDIILGDS